MLKTIIKYYLTTAFVFATVLTEPDLCKNENECTNNTEENSKNLYKKGSFY